MVSKDLLTCPFCTFQDNDEHFLLQHVETMHPEDDDSSFLLAETPTQKAFNHPNSAHGKSDDDYIECMCGEFCRSSEFDSHLEMHTAEGTAFEEMSGSPTDSIPQSAFQSRDCNAQTPPSTHLLSTASPRSEELLTKSLVNDASPLGSLDRGHDEDQNVKTPVHLSVSRASKFGRSRRHQETRRLGKAELGPHAHERQMPEWLLKILEKGARISVESMISSDGKLIRTEKVANEFTGLVPVISQLCAQDQNLSKAYLCHPSVTHVVKMDKEGGFCGYRNIQMMISHIQATKSPGCNQFQGRLPSILRLQDMIESAWDMGFGTLGRIETGGIKGTRKYIGTPEAQALFESLEIRCHADAFNDPLKGPASKQLLEAVEKYFSDVTSDTGARVCQTSLPPIYFQHHGHSLTIIGFERRKSGTCNLLVFDPMFQPSPGIRRIIGTRFRTNESASLLKAYRRGDHHLGRFENFEILRLPSYQPKIC